MSSIEITVLLGDGINVNWHILDMDIVRITAGGTYDAPGQLIGNRASLLLRMVERKPCEKAATFAFQLARS